jgi:hypothetical protein
MGTRRLIPAVLAAGWVLLHSADPGARDASWRSVGSYPTEDHCEWARTGETERETLQRIGGALASQPADNPMRQAAYRSAQGKVAARYRCEPE